MTIVVKASEPHDFLALVPRLVGFHPQNSIVFVAFRGTRTCGAMRYDLPSAGVATDSRHFRRIATTLVGMFSKLRGIDAVVPVVFTDEGFETPDGPVFGDFVDAVVDRFEFSGFRVRDALCVAADGWGSYFDAGVPAAGHPLGLIEDSTVHAGLPRDAPGLGDIDDWVRLPRVDAATVERVARRLDALRDAHAAGQLHPRSNLFDGVQRPDAAPTWLDLYRLADLVGFIEAGLDPEPSEIGDSAAALLIFIAASPSLRDVVLMQWAFDRETGERVYDDAVSFGAGKPADSLDTARLMLGEGRDPIRTASRPRSTCSRRSSHGPRSTTGRRCCACSPG
ncbi:hypothetical protein HD599_001010 [Conyzicola lurida]|uniref:DUF4192 family protein n=1 Tax=Conyzicola lurida TaxID=1172621 RepID=A0A841AHI1_9MICO|nr:DUF4192 family protein [Conyzicola lurida]MBB5842687.1 hypothetical protein [Conyzicola lurida]